MRGKHDVDRGGSLSLGVYKWQHGPCRELLLKSPSWHKGNNNNNNK